VIASDGLWELMDNESVLKLLYQYPDPQQGSKEIGKEVDRLCKLKRLNSDNVTVVIVHFLEGLAT
jgi:serine/threonine protein phosphatase PrpC